MTKEKVIKCIENNVASIMTSPELFKSGVDEDIIELLLQIKEFIEKEMK